MTNTSRHQAILKRLLIYGFLLVALLGANWQAQFLKDFYIAKTHPLQPEAAQLLNRLPLSATGERLYRASKPQVLGPRPFTVVCRDSRHNERVVIGCFSSQNDQIYVYNVTDPELDGVREVTAAHELLHAAYERLSSAQLAELNPLLRQAEAGVESRRLKQAIEYYRKEAGDDFYNELHSLIGTELAVLPPALEAHYRTYFHDRQKLVRMAARYDAKMTVIDDAVLGFDKQLQALDEQRAGLQVTIDSQASQLQQQRAVLDSALVQGNTSSYNQLVPSFNLLVADYNQNITSIESIIKQYNTIVEQRNSTVVSGNKLLDKLDSTKSPTKYF